MAVPAAPELPGVLGAWSLEPVTVAGLATAAVAYGWACNVVRSITPGHAVPRGRAAAFFAGLTVVAVALLSPVDTYAEALLSVHMAQHVLLTLVAAPLLLLGRPGTIALRVVSPERRTGGCGSATGGRSGCSPHPRCPGGRRGPLRPLRRAGPHLGAHPAGRPAPGGRPHVGGGRPDPVGVGAAGGLRLGPARGAGDGACRAASAAGTGAGPGAGTGGTIRRVTGGRVTVSGGGAGRAPWHRTAG